MNNPFLPHFTHTQTGTSKIMNYLITNLNAMNPRRLGIASLFLCAVLLTFAIVGHAATAPAVQFSAANYAVAKGANNAATITVTRTGDTSGASSVNYATLDGTATQKSDFTIALGTLTFAAGETSKTFDVLVNTDGCACGNETASVALNTPVGATLGSQRVATLTITDASTSNSPTNPIFDQGNFVDQLYHDFIYRLSDSAGHDFWTNQITSCGTDQQCVDTKRDAVSEAFFFSIEFQGTGYFVARTNKAGFGDVKDNPSYREFMRDLNAIIKGVVVGAPGYEQQLEANKTAFLQAFVSRPGFEAAFPEGMPAGSFVDGLFANAASTPSQSERNAATAAYGGGDMAGRAAALRSVIESGVVYNRLFNESTVSMVYFGYLRRNPNDAPDNDFGGYDFWVSKLNAFTQPGDDARDDTVARARVRKVELLRAFGLSREYFERFDETPDNTPASVFTSTGRNVSVRSGGITVTYASVSSFGNTTFTPINPASAGTLPDGYALDENGIAFDITTTATYTPPITVCLDVPASLSQQTFSALLLLHGENGTLVNRTTNHITNPDGTREVCGSVSSLSPFVLAQTTTPAQLLNISTRMEVVSGQNTLGIGGFIISGNGSKKVIIRGIGPELSAVGLNTVLADPTLELHTPTNNGDVVLATNDNWKVNDQTQQSQEATVTATGKAPTNDAESAIVMTLPTGNYTAHLRGKNGGTGIGLVEIYDLDPGTDVLSNISTRGFVDTGDNVMIGGFIIGSSSGTSATVVVRALGPSMAQFFTGTLADPNLSLHDANGTLIAFNDDYQSDSEANQLGSYAPPDRKESALHRTLAPGNYTGIVRGKDNTTGVALVEVYYLQ